MFLWTPVTCLYSDLGMCGKHKCTDGHAFPIQVHTNKIIIVYTISQFVLTFPPLLSEEVRHRVHVGFFPDVYISHII